MGACLAQRAARPSHHHSPLASLTQGPGTGDTRAPALTWGRPGEATAQSSRTESAGPAAEFPGIAPHVGNARPSLSGLVAGALLLERGLRPCWALDCNPNLYVEAQSPQNGTGDN